jgi:hypothetical protein
LGTERQSWHRRTTWLPSDREAFFARLGRSRSSRAKARYLGIQAWHLASTGEATLVRGALELLDVLFRWYSDVADLTQGHDRAAHCHVILGDVHSAVRHFRLAWTADDARPRDRARAGVGFAWFIATRKLTSLHGEALHILDTTRATTLDPVDIFRAEASRALIAAGRGDFDTAADRAVEALAMAERAASEARARHAALPTALTHESILSRLRELELHA